MDSKFKITLDYLKDIGACPGGRQAFAQAFPEGGGYQEVLDRCAEEGRPDFGAWLLAKLGPTDDVRIFEENVSNPDLTIVFAGRIEFRVGATVKRLIAGRGIKAGLGIEAGRGIEAGCGIKAGGGIKAGLGIKAGWGIEAGEGIKAGWGIEAGEDFGIFAGLRVKMSMWSNRAVVTAETRPDNLVSGHWDGGLR